MLDARPSAFAGSPRHLAEVEQLTGVPFFTDTERATILRNNPNALSPADLQERTLLYTAGLRILAEQRRYGNTPEQETRARFIGQQLMLINNVERYGPVAPEHLLPHQRPITNFMLNMITSRPEEHQLTEIARYAASIDELFTKGGIFVSATGTGKTVQARAVFTQLGIDSEENQRRTEPLWGLLVANGRDAVQQFTGLTGDDTFRRFGPEVSVTPFFEDIRDASGLIVVVTKHMFVQRFRNNAFDGRPMPAIIVLDEVHGITEPLMRKTLMEHYRGPVVGFTATPAYSPEKDAGKILPYVVRRGNLFADTRAGILNGAQLFTFMVEPRLDAAMAATHDLTNVGTYERAGELLLDRAIVDYVVDRVKTGRRGIVYCGRGDESDHARRLADAISGKYITMPNGSKIRIIAEAIGVFQSDKKNDQIIRDYHAGKIDVLTTVEKARESFNGEVDFIAFAMRTTSLLRLRQMIGRGTRPSEAFPITEYAEFILPCDAYDNQYVNLWDAFGLTEIEQGMVIRPGPSHRQRMANRDAALGDALAKKQLDEELKVLRQQDLSVELQEYGNYAMQKLSEIVITTDAKPIPPEGCIPLPAIMKATRLSATHISQLLQHFPRYGTWEETPDGEEQFVRYYPAETLEYLLVHRAVEIKPPSDRLSAFGMSKRIGCSIGFAQKSIALGVALGLSGFGHTYGQPTVNGSRVPLYGPEVFRFVAAKYAEIPPPQPGEKTIDELWEELGTSRGWIDDRIKEGEITTKPRRRSNNSLGAYLVAQDLERIREAFYSTPLAEPTEFTLQEILRLSRVSHHDPLITQAERAPGQKRRRIESVGEEALMLPLDSVLSIVQRLLPESLPAYLAPRPLIIGMINKSAPMVDKELTAFKAELKKLPNSSGIKCYPWDALIAIGNKLGYKAEVPLFDHSMLPSSAAKSTPQQRAFARALQEKYLRKKLLIAIPTFEEVTKEVEKIVTQRQEMREKYLSQFDRAQRWKLPSPPSNPTLSTTSMPSPSGARRPSLQSTINDGYTAQEIAQQAGVSPQVVQEVLTYLAPEYASAYTIGERIEKGLKEQVYRGKYLDAILMTLIGRTPERIAEIAGMPADKVTTFLRERFTANDKGRYDLKAMTAVLTEFRRPPSRGYAPLQQVTEVVGSPEKKVIDTLVKFGGRVEYYYNFEGTPSPYISAFNIKLAHVLLQPSHYPAPTAKPEFYNRFELQRRYPEYSSKTIDSCLQNQTIIKEVLWLKVRNITLALGAPILPHYPVHTFEKLLNASREI